MPFEDTFGSFSTFSIWFAGQAAFLRENEKINEAYEMAQIDNMMFDLDRELKKTNDNE